MVRGAGATRLVLSSSSLVGDNRGSPRSLEDAIKWWGGQVQPGWCHDPVVWDRSLMVTGLLRQPKITKSHNAGKVSENWMMAPALLYLPLFHSLALPQWSRKNHGTIADNQIMATTWLHLPLHLYKLPYLSYNHPGVVSEN